MRTYEKTHPWITFDARELNDVHASLWMSLGEARSKCEHLAGAPLKPEVAQRLLKVMLVQGVHATTAIEGNTLTEDQVAGIVDGTYKAPPSRQYQEQEVRNVVDALSEIYAQLVEGEELRLSTALIFDYNRRVLKGLELEPHVVPGEIRTYSVGVSNYRGAPAEDCAYLLERMTGWLEGPLFESDDPDMRFALTLAKAVLAHLYLAWIHPFGDGNGRTARLVEFVILARSGMVPMPAAHLLSNHYNLTRDRYYRELAAASAPGGRFLSFFGYAAQGFVDGLREAIVEVRHQQMQVAWLNYVHERFAEEPNTKAMDRQRSLVLALPMRGGVSRSTLRGLTPKLSALYAQAGSRTMSRDVNHLWSMGLVTRVRPNAIEARSDLVEAFLPPMAAGGR